MPNHDYSKDWEKISKALFRQSGPEEGSEAFVRGVMRRIEESGQNPAAGPRLVRVPTAWLAPIMSVAAVLILAILPSKNLAYNPDMIFSDYDLLEPDDVLEYVLEAQS